MTRAVSGAHSYRSPDLVRALAALALSLSADAASAYVGPSFLQVGGIDGAWTGKDYEGWIKLEAQYWTNSQVSPYMRPGLKRTHFSGPQAVNAGPGKLALALDKKSPAFKPLMDKCLSKAPIAELKYAENADLARATPEYGPRPSSIPAYFEYALKNVTLSCPVAADAPEQAFVLSFNDIKWLNYDGKGEPLEPTPARLKPAQASGKSRTFVLTFIGSATDASASQCPVLSEGPKEADYYAYLPQGEAAKEKAALAGKGGVMNTPDGPLFRGPGRLNACRLPGIVPDPGHASPQSDVAWGLDLDGDDGNGAPPAGVRKHKNYMSPDGRSGIDNQLYTVDGCIPGLKRKGLLTAARNETMRNGAISILIEVSGIEDAQNDDNVDVTVLYSKDAMTKNAAGSIILRNFTYRVSDDPELTQHFARVRGRIKDGVVETDSLDAITLHEAGMLRLTFHDARLRIELQPDGSMKGLIGGYQDWRELMNFWGPQRRFENGMGFRCPAMYQTFKRAADGMQDPVSGEFTGISSTYEFEGVPAFIPPKQQRALSGGSE